MEQYRINDQTGEVHELDAERDGYIYIGNLFLGTNQEITLDELLYRREIAELGS